MISTGGITIKYVHSSDLKIDKIDVILATSAVIVYTFYTIAFLIKKSWRNVQVNVLTPQERGLCEESNEINGEKIVLCLTAEKKLFALDKF